jgi:uncharacterized protein YqjF (DUF2071 family)
MSGGVTFVHVVPFVLRNTPQREEIAPVVPVKPAKLEMNLF